MKKVIYLFILFLFWGCMLEESPPEISSSGEQSRNGLALFFEQKLEARLLTRSGELETISAPRTPLTEQVRYGYSAVYGGHYFIVPLRQESTGQIDAGLIYPLTDSDDLTLSGDLDAPLLLDEAALNAVPDSCRFLLSNKFLSWKKEGLSVSRSLYAYAESLDGKSVFTPFDKSSSENKHSATRSTDIYPYKALVYIDYEMTPNVNSSDDGVIVYLPSMQAREDVFLSTLNHLEFIEGIGECELTALGGDYLHLRIAVAGENVVEEAVEVLMQTVAYQFEVGYTVGDLSYFYHYTLFLDFGIISEGEGSGVGGGSSGGGGSSSNSGGNTGSKPSIELMDASKFFPWNTFYDCFKGCTLIMQNYGVPPGSRSHVYLLLAEDQTTGELYHHGDNPVDEYAKAIACIDRHLDATPSRPIVVGLNEEPFLEKNDGATDHFVVITGRGYDTSQGMYYYTYMETGVSDVNKGCDVENNRLYYDPKNLTFRGVSKHRDDEYQYDVTQVRPNDSQNLGETETYERVDE